ncbi:putative diguanylate cyclase YdaM [bacterium YEK0313]|nr:putative diguanylate cyclase YdaM [bacterium YEK0313]
MPITPIDWIVPAGIMMCGLAFIGIRFLGFSTARWGYSLCFLAGGYALMLLEAEWTSPFKQIAEDNFILISVILACRALNERLDIKSSLSFDIGMIVVCTTMIVVALTLLKSVRWETIFVQACCAFTLWIRTIRFSRIAATKADRLLAWTFLVFAVLLTFQCLIYIAGPQAGQQIGAWRSSVLGNLVQYTGLIGSIVLAFAVMIATSLDAIETYRRTADTDPLTNLLNRRGLDSLLASRRGRQLLGPSTAVILADIDHFKTINDRFGHTFGDLVITRFGALLQARAGEQGCVIRLGGEEFGVLLPDIPLDEAIGAAEVMRRQFAAERWTQSGADGAFTASFGVTLTMDGEPIEGAFERADQFLYAAKRAGRNCTVGGQYSVADGEENGLVFAHPARHAGPAISA